MKHLNYQLLLSAAVLLISNSCSTPDQRESIDIKNNGLNDPIPYGTYTAQSLSEEFNVIDSIYQSTLNQIQNVDTRTFENTMLALDELNNKIWKASGIFSILTNAHGDSLIRATAFEKRNELSKLSNEKSLNEDLYKAVKAYSETEEAKSLTGYKKLFVEDQLRSFERNGFALPAEKRTELKALLDEISEIGSTFRANIANYQDFSIFTEEQMDGTTEDYKKAHLQEDGTYKIGLSYPDYIPFMKNATDASARKELYLKYQNRAADSNLKVLNDLISTRMEYSNLLGYDTYAQYITEERMAKNPENVWTFEKDLEVNVKPKGDQDYQELLAMQKRLGIDGDEVMPYTSSYVKNQMLQTDYGVDSEKVREYFELENVKSGLFQITQKLFGLTYVKMENPSVWHEEASGYEVYDDDRFIGRFYLDLHPRANKYSHAACWGTVPSKKSSKGIQRPSAVLLCNFTKPTEDKPALLTHSEVETFFHEFGHVLHNILSETALASQSGTAVSRDFVEAPSQIFENWVWNYESLSLFAKHYDTGETLPKELFDKMYAAKNVGSGTSTLGQIFLGQFDFSLYDGFVPGGEISTTEVGKALQSRILPYPSVEGTHFEAAFGHLYHYAASYYGYLWSKVFAEDMFSRFEKEGILNPEVGAAYRDAILSKGGTEDEMDMLIEFLGRKPNQEAFIKSIGLEL
ncbi:MAG: M3 family metallopeptidase [Cyclobacteriaceae bacterium]